MILDPYVETAAAEMVRVYGRHADMACESMIGKPADQSGAWPKILEAVRKLNAPPPPG